MKTVNFSVTIAAFDLRVGRCRQLIKLFKTCHFSILAQEHLHMNIKTYFFQKPLGHFLQSFIFSSPEPKAHGELIGYPWSGVGRLSVRRPSFTISNIFFSKTTWPIKAKFNVESPWVRGTKFVCGIWVT